VAAHVKTAVRSDLIVTVPGSSFTKDLRISINWIALKKSNHPGTGTQA